MSRLPTVFISATTHGLGKCRVVVRDTLLTLRTHPISEENFPPDYHSLTEILTTKISESDAVICLVGRAYGEEPTNAQHHRSNSQIEYDIAVKLEKPVFTFFAADDFPYDPYPEEDNERVELQRSYIDELISKNDRYRDTFHSPDELARRVSQMGVALWELLRQRSKLTDEVQQLQPAVQTLKARSIGLGVAFLLAASLAIWQSYRAITYSDMLEASNKQAESDKKTINQSAEQLGRANQAAADNAAAGKMEKERAKAILRSIDELATLQNGVAHVSDLLPNAVRSRQELVADILAHFEALRQTVEELSADRTASEANLPSLWLLQQSYQSLEGLATAVPGNTAIEHTALALCDALAARAKESKRLDGEFRYYRGSLKIRLELAKTESFGTKPRRELLATYENFLGVAYYLGETGPNVTRLEADVQTRLQPGKPDAGSVDAWRSVLTQLQQLGDLARAEHPDDAVKHYVKAKEVLAKLILIDASAGMQRQLSNLNDTLGDLCREEGNPDKSIDYYKQAREAVSKLAQGNPPDQAALELVSNAEFKIGLADLQRFDYASAIQRFRASLVPLHGLAVEQSGISISQSAIQFCQDAVIATTNDEEQLPKRFATRAGLLLAIRCNELARKGNRHGAVGAADKLRAIATSNKRFLYYSALSYAICARLVESPPVGGAFPPLPGNRLALSSTELAEKAKYGTLAREDLQAVLDAGYRTADRLEEEDYLVRFPNLPEVQPLLERLDTR
jgi:tetratricopeptide (TPR) repeat protein